MRSMENISRQRKEDQKFELPPGFRFHPTDEELISHYLTKKVVDSCFIAMAIAEVDFNKCEPWDLPGLAKTGETEWYYFCLRDRKYPTGLRTNRATDAGYWKATGKDKEIITMENALIGMRKTLVFYKGRAPNGEKTNWVMHEYRLEARTKHAEYNNVPKLEKSEWVICKVFKKSPCGNKIHIPTFGRFNSFGEDQETHDNTETPSLDFSSSFDKENPALSNQCTMMAHAIGKSQSQYSNYFLPEEHSMFRSGKQNQNEEFSLGRDFDAVSDISSLVYNNNNDMFQRWFGNQEHSSASSGDLDIDCLWNQITD